MLHRLLCLLVGYLCGGFLTAELVARTRTGKSAAALGTGNPGMANLAHELGKGWGAVVLAGDIAKTALAFGLCRALFPALGGLSGLWAGLGAVLGHNFPFWRGFRGGKGVAVTCAALILFSPLWGDGRLSGRTGRHPALRLAAPGGGGDPRPVCPPGLSLPRPGGRAAGPDSGPGHALPAHPGAGPHPPGGGGAEIPRPLSPLRGSRKILRILPFRRRFVV